MQNMVIMNLVQSKQIYTGAVVDQWIRPQTLNREVPGSNLLAEIVVPLGKALYPNCL